MRMPAAARKTPVTQNSPSGIVVTTHGLNAGTTIAKDQCLSLPAGAGAAYECGELRLVHPLPTTVTMGAPHTPAVIYNSEHAHPRAVVVAEVTIPASVGQLSQVTASLRVAGKTINQSWWWDNTWAFGVAHRISINVDAQANTIPTGIYPDTLNVSAVGSLSTVSATSIDTLTIVDRSSSPYGEGWWLDGLEQLLSIQGDTSSRLWIGADGSTRRYVKRTATIWTVDANTADRPDTLELIGSTMRRHLGGGAYVEFDGLMRHSRTVTGGSHPLITQFWRSATIPDAIDSISLPVASGASPKYALAYHSDSKLLWTIDAPARSGSTRRVTLVHNGDHTLQSITDPDNRSIIFGYVGGYVTSRTNKLSRVTNFAYDGLKKLQAVTADLSQPGDQAQTVQFCAAESRGSTTCALAPTTAQQAYTIVQDPRTDLVARTQYRINRFGAPDVVVDALGHPTTVSRDPTFPILAARVVAANGQETRIFLNPSALPDSVTATGAYSDTERATTHYVWDPKWQVPTSVTSATGLVSTSQYDDSTGNLQYQQPGSDATRRTTYTYFSTSGLLQTVTPPSPLGTTTYTYDAWGNAATTTNPRGLVATAYHDAMGRDSVSYSPIDAVVGQSLSLQLQTTHLYDALGRDSVLRQTAPTASGNSTQQTVAVFTYYDAEGHPTSTVRRFDAAMAGTNDVVENVEYDASGRPTRRYDPNKPSGNQTLLAVSYDPTGRWVTTTRATGTDVVELDALGRPKTRVIDDSLHSADAHDAQSSLYDDVGNLTQALNRYAQVGRTYFPNGALKSETQAIATSDLSSMASHVYTMSYTYDRDGRRKTMTRPNNLGLVGLFGTQTYDYDPLTGALSDVIGPISGTFHYAYTLAGTLQSLTRPDGSVETYATRTDGLPDGRTEVSAASVSYHTDAFTFDGRGKILNNQATTFSQPHSQTYTYAGLGGVLSATGPQSESYGRDAIGEVTSRQVSTPTWSGGFINSYEPHSTRLSMSVGTQLTGQGTDSLSVAYYQDGSVRSRAEFAIFPADCSPSFCNPPETETTWSRLTNGYDGAGHLRESEMTTSNDNFSLVDARPIPAYAAMGYGVLEDYRYDALGRRVWRRAVRDWYCANVDVSRYPTCLSDVERFVYDGDHVLYEIRQPGSASSPASVLESDSGADEQFGVVAYEYGLGTDQPIALMRSTAATPVLLYLHRDFQGNVDFSTLSTGLPYDCGRLGATPGNCSEIAWPGLDMSVGFQRPVTNEGYANWWGTLIAGNANATGVIDMRARQFDPKLGVFLQEDPIGIGGGFNTYGFGGGDAVNFRDLSGLCPTGFIEQPDSRPGHEPWCVDPVAFPLPPSVSWGDPSVPSEPAWRAPPAGSPGLGGGPAPTAKETPKWKQPACYYAGGAFLISAANDVLTVSTGVAAAYWAAQGASLATKLSVGRTAALETFYGAVTQQAGMRRTTSIVSNATLNSAVGVTANALGGSGFDFFGTVFGLVPFVGSLYSGYQAYRACF